MSMLAMVPRTRISAEWASRPKLRNRLSAELLFGSFGDALYCSMMHPRWRILVAVATAALLIVVAAYMGKLPYQQPRGGLRDLAVAWDQVQAQPDNGTAWGGLADAQTSVDQLNASEESYRRALNLTPEDDSLYARLGFLLYAQGDDDRALPLLREALQRGVDVPLLKWTVSSLEHKNDVAPAVAVQPIPSPPPEVPTSTDCTLPLTRLGSTGVFTVTVQIADSDTVLIVDTGASVSAINERLLNELHIDIDQTARIKAVTAAGPIDFATAHLPTLRLADKSATLVRVAVCNECGGADTAGLLGLDLQQALGVTPDLAHARLKKVGCEAP